MITTVLQDRPTDHVPADRPVLVVLDLGRSAEAPPAGAVLAAYALGVPVRLVVVAPRVGFSTDPALVAGARRRTQRAAAASLRALRRQIPQAGGPAELLWYARTPVGRPAAQARRAVERAARRHDARAVILPAHLEA